MPTKRQYSEKEIAAIFERATRAQEASSQANPHEKGLTLPELQAIGAASGITPEFIAQAAATIDHVSEVAPPIRYLGQTVSVGRTVQLPGKLSDEAWELLVVELRKTFQARGALQREGSLRQWTSGNVQVLIEPTEQGEQLRMKARNVNRQSLLGSGATGLVTVLILMTAALWHGGGAPVGVAVLATVVLSLFAGIFGWGAFKLQP